ncbi:energy transducer TonB [Myxococcus sp. XM-1-1-1]|uniref:energy transducer TonB n=1 Tax=Myxococcus sp. XM-1-1-1 TaxID=2874602 RepID=UPI001CBEA49B|nr:energy transducer TonB [Myxococcus sp. XM-1-1-1]MBZ4413085.1 energy transducer TonB [Myxococcus sp. XM-1-1-1]
MRFANFVLGAVLSGLCACSHSRLGPTLPASHGHLSRTMAQHLDPKTEGLEVQAALGVPSHSVETSVVVEPAEAPAIFAEAVQVLSGKPTEEQVRQASADLSAACDAALTQACDYLRTNFQPPRRIAGEPPGFPEEAMRERAMAVVIVTFQLGVDGLPRHVQVLESAPYGLTEAMLTSVKGMRFQPAMLAGHPIEIPYQLQMNTRFPGAKLTPQEELEWGRTRAAHFPTSPAAWAHVARAYARDLPEDPQYERALRKLTVLAPNYWWAATELAWLHARAGRYDEAAPLARVGRKMSSHNPYALETSALVAFHQGRCQQAVQEQQQAVAKLPAKWPREEQERFQRVLTDYQRQCETAPTPASH